MTDNESLLLNIAVALGIGRLIGAERERHKGPGPLRSPAEIRTFAINSLAGAISVLIGGETLLAITTAGIIALIAIAYPLTDCNCFSDGPHSVGRFGRITGRACCSWGSGAQTGGASVLRPMLRVIFWGAIAMGATAAIGRLVGHAL